MNTHPHSLAQPLAPVHSDDLYYNGANMDVTESPKLTCGGNSAAFGGSWYQKSSYFI